MTPQKLFPTILISLQAIASVVYMVGGDWRKAIYWGAAAALNIVVTY